MIKFKTLEELNEFKDKSMWCVCGQLMTGLHMSRCSKLHKLENNFKVVEKCDG